MKNVTGLDLVKLSCGAFGTLGLLTEVTFKVLPQFECTATLAYYGLKDRAAIAVLTDALASPYEVTAAAHLPAGIGHPVARTLLRIEGFQESVRYRIQKLRSQLAGGLHLAVIEGTEAIELWSNVRDARLLAEPSDAVIWRVSVRPLDGPRLVADLGALRVRYFYDWGGGLIWLAVGRDYDANEAAIRSATARYGGHVTLIRAPDDVRARVPVFQTITDPVRKLAIGMKQCFDPDRVLNVGRMYSGV